MNPDPATDPGSFLVRKLQKISVALQSSSNCYQASPKDFQNLRLGSLWPSSKIVHLSKHFTIFFSYLVNHFCLPGFRSGFGFTDPNESGPDPDSVSKDYL